MSLDVVRWFLLYCRLFARRDFGLKLRDYLPGKLAFNRKHIGDIAIVAFRPKLAVGPRIDQLSADAHPAAGALHAASQHMRDAELFGNLTQISHNAALVLHYRCPADYF